MSETDYNEMVMTATTTTTPLRRPAMPVRAQRTRTLRCESAAAMPVALRRRTLLRSFLLSPSYFSRPDLLSLRLIERNEPDGRTPDTLSHHGCESVADSTRIHSI